jgi:hypothetical protein
VLGGLATITSYPPTYPLPWADPGRVVLTLAPTAASPISGLYASLVAPAGLMSTLGGDLPLFASMTLTDVPEPGTLLLLGSGIVGLAIFGCKRMRR